MELEPALEHVPRPPRRSPQRRPRRSGLHPQRDHRCQYRAAVAEIDFQPRDEILTTDHDYNACINAIRVASSRTGVHIVVAHIPFPPRKADEVCHAILAAVTSRTRLAVISHITSPTALVWPIDQIVAGLAERGIDTLVDGAHAPGMVPLDIDALGAAYYTGNCHKWLCGPKGSGFLHVRRDRQAGIHPLVTSHGANSPRRDRSPFRLEFDWLGTSDPTAYLSIPAALDFMGGLVDGGWPKEVMSRKIAKLVLVGRRKVLEAIPQTSGEPVPNGMIGSMATIELPADLDPRPTKKRPIRTIWRPTRSIRFTTRSSPSTDRGTGFHLAAHTGRRPAAAGCCESAQAYNSAEDYERLAAALGGADRGRTRSARR